MQLTAEDIRFARPRDLEELTDISASSFTSWTRGRRLSERTIATLSNALGVDTQTLITGLNLRRQNAARAQEAIAKFQMLIAQRNAA